MRMRRSNICVIRIQRKNRQTVSIWREKDFLELMKDRMLRL